MRAFAPSAVHAQPNVTPMIDVMLVLLIIFMVVTPALLEGTPLQLPHAVNLRSHPHEETDHTLAISSQGEYYLDKRPVATQELPSLLRAMYLHRETDRVLYVRADVAVDYARVIDALDIAEKAGVRVVGMIAQPPRRAAAIR